MPFLTLQILFAPATNAKGKPGIAVRTDAAGTVILPVAFLIGIRFGIEGLAYAWLGGMILLTAVTGLFSKCSLAVASVRLSCPVRPGLLPSAALGALVLAHDSALPPLPPHPRVCRGHSAGRLTDRHSIRDRGPRLRLAWRHDPADRGDGGVFEVQPCRGPLPTGPRRAAVPARLGGDGGAGAGHRFGAASHASPAAAGDPDRCWHGHLWGTSFRLRPVADDGAGRNDPQPEPGAGHHRDLAFHQSRIGHIASCCRFAASRSEENTSELQSL